MTARIDRQPEEAEACVVVGWSLDEDGRKLLAGTALYGRDGEPMALCRQVWIVPAADRRLSGGEGSGEKRGEEEVCGERGGQATRRDEHAPVVVVAGEQVDPDGLLSPALVPQPERFSSWRTPHSRTSSNGAVSDSVRAPRDVAADQVGLAKPGELEDAATDAEHARLPSQTTKPVDGAG